MHVRRVADRVHLPFAPLVTITSLSLKIGVSRTPADPTNVMVSARRPGVEVPDPGAHDPVAEAEGGRSHVLCAVGGGGVDREAGHAGDRTQEEVEQIHAVRAEVEEQAGAGNRGIEPPVGALGRRQRLGDRDVYRRDRPIAFAASRSRTSRNRGSARR